MVLPNGYQYLIALRPTSVRVIAGGARCEIRFPVDPGYPRFNDDDPANDSRGEYVVTWRFTIPRGTYWGATPATAAEMLTDTGEVFYKTTIPPLRTSNEHASKLYINLVLRNKP